MIIGFMADLSECYFAIKFEDDTKKELVKTLMAEGFTAWNNASDPDIEPTEHFTIEEVASFYESGHTEPISELLDRFQIAHEVLDIEYDEEGNAVNIDVVVNY